MQKLAVRFCSAVLFLTGSILVSYGTAAVAGWEYCAQNAVNPWTATSISGDACRVKSTFVQDGVDECQGNCVELQEVTTSPHACAASNVSCQECKDKPAPTAFPSEVRTGVCEVSGGGAAIFNMPLKCICGSWTAWLELQQTTSVTTCTTKNPCL